MSACSLDDLAEEARALGRRLRSPAGEHGSPSEPPTAGALLASLGPALRSFGITRVGDLTGLDTIGIPVFFACRPNSRTLSVSQGKSLCVADARRGAIMEALEQAVAERHESLVVESASRREMVSRGLECLNPATTLRCFPDDRDHSRQRCWVRGVSLRDGRDVHAPFELAGLDFRTGAGWDNAAYRMSTVGLAAGVSLADAALHGLQEAIENDATALVDILGLRTTLARPVLIRPGRHPMLDEAVAKVERASLRCFFAELRGGVEIATIAAFVTSPLGVHENLGMRSFAGFACRLIPEQAALDALLEAVQSRLTQLAGSRDDLEPENYRQGGLPLGDLASTPVWLDEIDRHADDSTAFGEAGLRRLLSILPGHDGADVLLIPLGAVEPSIRVVRIIVSGLQSAAGNGVVRLSANTLETMLAGTRVLA
ncbi:YcaO-like family protein [Mesorhizobium sp. M1396]|uniref:YcaO-like family protein n=1 Tax=Mesorhizobium sp. M1396 TaxID=2957095 RepID=UPI00333B5605